MWVLIDFNDLSIAGIQSGASYWTGKQSDDISICHAKLGRGTSYGGMSLHADPYPQVVCAWGGGGGGGGGERETLTF